MSFSTVFHETLSYGCCVGVELPSGDAENEISSEILGPLAPLEREFAAGLAPKRKVTFVGGRLAARAALADLKLTAPAILPDERGAPGFPAGTRGSISHKARLAVALASRDDGWTLGVDAELRAGPVYDISRRVLSALEQERLAAAAPNQRAREVLFAFAAKEALYKALDPHVRRYVAFDEVSVLRDADGRAHFELHLRHGEGPFDTELRSWLWQEMLIVVARVRPAPPAP